MSEWFKVQTWNVCVGATLPRVRISPSPFFIFAIANWYFCSRRRKNTECQSTTSTSCLVRLVLTRLRFKRISPSPFFIFEIANWYFCSRRRKNTEYQSTISTSCLVRLVLTRLRLKRISPSPFFYLF